MTSLDIQTEIVRLIISNPDRELGPLAQRLRREDSSLVFQSLFSFAAHSQRLGPAAGAAWLLHRVSPKCPIPCRDAIREMLTDWDVSIEELPFYLADQFGTQQVLTTVDELELSITDKTQLTMLSVIRYWINCYRKTN
jgi:hypothetical protein